MDVRTAVARFREEFFDREEPYLWSDDLVRMYFDEAQTQLCRETEGIEDVRTLQVLAGATLVSLDARILKIRSARDAHGAELDIMSPEDVASKGQRAASGRPRALIVRTRGKVEVWPSPQEDTTLTLDVFRLPLDPLESGSDEFEVDDMHMPGLLHYVAYRAYARPDPDTLDRTRSDFHRNEFAAYCAKATKEQGRRRKPSGATVFSW